MKKNKFMEGTIFSYFTLIITKVIGALYVIPLKLIIGKVGGTLYTYAYTIYSLFLDISTSGVPTAISMTISEYNSKEMYNEREFAHKIANRIVSMVSIIAFTLMFLFAEFFAKFFISGIDESQTSIESITLVIRVISFCLLVIPFLSTLRGYLQGNKYVTTSSTSQLIEQLVRVGIALGGSYLAIKVWNLNIPIGVAFALSGTVLGGVAAYLYLRIKVYRNKKELMQGVTSYKDSKVSTKEVAVKIFSRAIPVIIIAATQNIYNIVDIKLINQGLFEIGFDAETCQFIASIVATWAPKICMIINSIAISLCLSIIPFITNSYLKNDHKEINSKFNQAINTILYVSIPLATLLCFFKDEVYTIFYEYDEYGGWILGVNAVLSIFFCIQMVMDMILQSMKNYKLVYINTFVGLFINAALDIPIILLLHKLNFHPYVGSMIASIVGQTVSILIIMIGMRNKYQYSFKPIVVNFVKIFFATFIAGFVVYCLKGMITISSSIILKVLQLGIICTIAMVIFFIITYKVGTFKEVFGEEFLKKFLKKA